MVTIRQLLDQKGGKICSIHPDATVFDAIAKMAENEIGSLIVMDGEALVGIMTERTTPAMLSSKAGHPMRR